MSAAIGGTSTVEYRSAVVYLVFDNVIPIGIVVVVTGAKVFLFGAGPKERTWCEGVSAQMPYVVSMVGRYKLDVELAMMSRLDVMLTMDSANMHLASLVGLRCLSIWGATHRYAGFLGYGQQEADCIERPLSCRPCSIYGNKPCHMGDYPCLKEITPQVVAERILNALHD